MSMSIFMWWNRLTKVKPDVKKKMKLKGMDPNFIRNMKFAKKHNLNARQLAKKEKAAA